MLHRGESESPCLPRFPQGSSRHTPIEVSKVKTDAGHSPETSLDASRRAGEFPAAQG